MLAGGAAGRAPLVRLDSAPGPNSHVSVHTKSLAATAGPSARVSATVSELVRSSHFGACRVQHSSR